MFHKCVGVAGHQTVYCVQIMRWWSSILLQRPLQNLGSIYNCYVFVYLTRPALSSCLLISFRGSSPSLPNTPHHGRVSTQDHTPTWASPVSVPEYQCLPPHSYSALSVLPPSDPSSLLPHLPDSCHRRTLASVKISSIVTLS